jgi:hypothetical protein
MRETLTNPWMKKGDHFLATIQLMRQPHQIPTLSIMRSYPQMTTAMMMKLVMAALTSKSNDKKDWKNKAVGGAI